MGLVGFEPATNWLKASTGDESHHQLLYHVELPGVITLTGPT